MKKFSWAMLFTFVIISAYPVSISGQTPDSTLFESDSMATEFFRVVASNRNESFIAQMEGELVESDSTLSWSMKIYQNGVSFEKGGNTTATSIGWYKVSFESISATLLWPNQDCQGCPAVMRTSEVDFFFKRNQQNEWALVHKKQK